jgi:hypothetical protein
MDQLPQIFANALPIILQNLPEEWLGTTFKNDENYVGREKFVDNLFQLLLRKHATSQGQPLAITAAELESVGNAEDYLRVASNPSTLLEAALGLHYGYAITHVYSFASSTMPIISVLYSTAPEIPVHVYAPHNPFTPTQQELLRRLNLNYVYAGTALPLLRPDEDASRPLVVLSCSPPSGSGEVADGYCHQGVLYIATARINHAEILVRRKRMSKPETTPLYAHSLLLFFCFRFSFRSSLISFFFFFLSFFLFFFLSCVFLSFLDYVFQFYFFFLSLLFFFRFSSFSFSHSVVVSRGCVRWQSIKRLCQ